jgi:hypothetical protein
VDGGGLAWKNLGVELVKHNDGALRHARPKRFNRNLGRQVQVEIQVEQAYYEVGAGLDVAWGCFAQVAFDQLDLGDMGERAVEIIECDCAPDFICARAGKRPALGQSAAAGAVPRVNLGKT